jgi:hypothetical protein
LHGGRRVDVCGDLIGLLDRMILGRVLLHGRHDRVDLVIAGADRDDDCGSSQHSGEEQ